MIYITGDTHRHDLSRIYDGIKRFSPDDYVIVLGDFGLLWHRDFEYEYILDCLNSIGCKILWLDGNHENHDWIDSLPVSKWHGGNIHYISHKVIHLMRGNIFDIEGKTFFVMGGAPSIDKAMRTEGISWWPREEISRDESELAVTNLEKVNYKVDYILTHTCPKSIITPMFRFPEETLIKSYTEDFLDEIAPKVVCKKWLFGHWHENKQYERYRCIYEDIIDINEA